MWRAWPVRCPFDDLIDIHGNWVAELLPAEREQSLRKIGAPLGGRKYFLHVVPYRIISLHFHFCQTAIADDCGQNIIEIVGHASGKQANGLHLLSVAELVLELPALRNVVRHYQLGAAAREIQRMGRSLDRDDGPVLFPVPPVAGLISTFRNV
jgi:hypothetical protein